MRSTLLALAIALTTAAACNPYLQPESPAPPGRAAQLDAVHGFWGVKRYRLELSQGAAIAVSCSYGGPCAHVTLTSADPTIAEARVGSLSALRERPFGAGHELRTESVAVIVAHAPGQTRIHLHADEGDRDVLVTVIPQPTR